MAKLEDDIRLDVFMHHKLGHCVTVLSVSITKADLGVAILEQAYCGHIEELYVLTEVHPEDPV